MPAFCDRSVSRRTALAFAAAAVVSQSLPASANERPTVVVHRDPSCGCCGAWAKHLERAGFPVRMIETSALQAVKQRFGVPDELASCHTAQVQGYILEGHVPLPAILRLLNEKPKAIGLAVPGMPIGSPGMEGGLPETYEVILFGPEGRRVYGRFRESREI